MNFAFFKMELSSFSGLRVTRVTRVLHKAFWFFKIRFYICGVIEEPWGEI